MRILSIGNSFSQDAQRYLHRLAAAEGCDVHSANLYIGGCTLERHFGNLVSDEAAYELEFNGEYTKIHISIKQALLAGWDFVTLQQASHVSGKYESYAPYVKALADAVRKYCPEAKLLVHETWAYEAGCERLASRGYATPSEMLADARECYIRMADEIRADGIIPSGEAMLNAALAGVRVHRDTFHASLGLGRYMIALVWYGALTGRDITGNAFSALDEPISDAEREIAINAAKSALCKQLITSEV